MDFTSSFVRSDNLLEEIGLGRLASLQLTGSVVGRVALTGLYSTWVSLHLITLAHGVVVIHFIWLLKGQHAGIIPFPGCWYSGSDHPHT